MRFPTSSRCNHPFSVLWALGREEGGGQKKQGNRRELVAGVILLYDSRRWPEEDFASQQLLEVNKSPPSP